MEQGRVVPLCRRLVSTRLGEGLEPGAPLTEAARRRTLAALAGFVQVMAHFRPATVQAVATSAAREARDGAEFAATAGRVLGAPVRVISGEEEARLSYLGAVTGLGLERAVVVDIGGGSTEFTYPCNHTLVSHSYPVGAVRCTAGGNSREEVEKLLAPVAHGVPPELPLVGVGGTVTTLAAVQMRLDPYDPERVHGSRLSAGAVDRLYAYLASLAPSERRQVPGLQPERADIIVAGTMILQVLLACLRRPEIVVSEADLLYALILTPELADLASAWS
ncbi:MAG: Ppx/GppA family phosphatase [Moorellales bacterium]